MGSLISAQHTTDMIRSSQNSGGASLVKLEHELELLGYITSHNLQGPLRNILSYCEDMRRQPGLKSKSVDPAVIDQLAHESVRLKDMMQLMVEYIQLETHKVGFAHVDCNEVMETVFTMLSQEIEKSGAKITYDRLPVVFGHRNRITRLFAYLIDNAIKFNKRTPQIEITSVYQNNFWEISVKDNGLGIDEDSQEIIFKLFKRLHTADAYPGYGAGLALAQKIVELHGGMIGVESSPDKGSRFYFTLPMGNM